MNLAKAAGNKPMRVTKKPRIALVWTQFAVHHVDRCSAVARRLKDRAEVLAVEIASTSREYAAFAPSGAVAGVTKVTLFPGKSFDEVPRWRRFLALFPQLIRCQMICFGVPYSQLEVLLLAWLLRLFGKKVVLLFDSKFDDRPRSAGFEFCKQLGLSCFDAALFASLRTRDYLQFLGFNRRPLLPGCDGIDLARLRADAAQSPKPPPAFADRNFVFVGRFIPEKNLRQLVAAYARYAESDPPGVRRLVLVGSGPLEEELRHQVAGLGLQDKIVFAGFLEGIDLAGLLATALGLILVSNSETWGLVVNEAAALGAPVIVSEAPGSRDALVRNLVSGFIVESGSVEGLATAMKKLESSPAAWQAMSDAIRARAWLGDASCFADSLEVLVDPDAKAAKQRVDAYLAACRS